MPGMNWIYDSDCSRFSGEAGYRRSIGVGEHQIAGANNVTRCDVCLDSERGEVAVILSYCSRRSRMRYPHNQGSKVGYRRQLTLKYWILFMYVNTGHYTILAQAIGNLRDYDVIWGVFKL
jgi:hypothetical protein